MINSRTLRTILRSPKPCHIYELTGSPQRPRGRWVVVPMGAGGLGGIKTHVETSGQRSPPSWSSPATARSSEAGSSAQCTRPSPARQGPAAGRTRGGQDARASWGALSEAQRVCNVAWPGVLPHTSLPHRAPHKSSGHGMPAGGCPDSSAAAVRTSLGGEDLSGNRTGGRMAGN